MTAARKLAVVVAPNGELMSWARGENAEQAILSFLPNVRAWPYAQREGYKLRWFAAMTGKREDGPRYRGWE